MLPDDDGVGDVAAVDRSGLLIIGFRPSASAQGHTGLPAGRELAGRDGATIRVS